MEAICLESIVSLGSVPSPPHATAWLKVFAAACKVRHRCCRTQTVITHKLVCERRPVTESLGDLYRGPVARARLFSDSNNVCLRDLKFAFAQELLDIACDVSLLLVRW